MAERYHRTRCIYLAACGTALTSLLAELRDCLRLLSFASASRSALFFLVILFDLPDAMSCCSFSRFSLHKKDRVLLNALEKNVVNKSRSGNNIESRSFRWARRQSNFIAQCILYFWSMIKTWPPVL